MQQAIAASAAVVGTWKRFNTRSDRMMWTMEQDNQLRELHVAKETFVEIGAQIGVTKNAAIGRAHRLGLPPRRDMSAPLKPRNRSPNRPKAEPRVSMQRVAMLLKTEPVSADIPPIGTKSLLDLAPDECRFPFGDKPYTFCGCRTFTGLPYCAGHARIAYGRVVVVRARAKVSRFGNWATGTME
jgi:GcrA cell cycle regulator